MPDVRPKLEAETVQVSWLRKKRAPKWSLPTASTLGIVDVFSGVGGLSLGACQALRTAGFSPTVLAAIEREDTYRRAFAMNLPLGDQALLASEAENVLSWQLDSPLAQKEEALARHAANTHLVLAGPPCQGHSSLNNSTRGSDERNRLYLLAARAVRILKPQAAIIENVQTVTRDLHGVVAKATGALQSWGYHVQDFRLRGTDVGLPQTRVRHFLVATQNPIPAFAIKPRRKSGVWRVISDLQAAPAVGSIFSTASTPSATNTKRIDYLFDHKTYDLPNSERPECHQSDHSYKSMYGRLRKDRPAQTITSGFGSMGQGRFVHPTQRRTITPHEAARIQGFPDFFDWSAFAKRGQLQEAIGNAVPPQLAEAIVQFLIAQDAFKNAAATSAAMASSRSRTSHSKNSKTVQLAS